MPQPAVKKRVKASVFEMFDEKPRLTTSEIRERLVSTADEATREGWAFKAPSERTIRRLHEEYVGLTDEERSQYHRLEWPESMELGAAITGLPWEASAAVLELLAFLLRKGLPRPTVRHGKWFWRITDAVPDAPLAYRALTSRLLAAGEVSGSLPSAELRKVEGYLAFARWRSDENKQSYRVAIDKGAVPRPILMFDAIDASHLPEELRYLTDLMEGDN